MREPLSQSYDQLREGLADRADQARKERKENGPDHRLFVNAERTVLVTLWDTGTVDVATREAAYHTWGPPLRLVEEKF